MAKVGLYIFSNDLRIEDNPGLTAASSEADHLLCLFCHIQPSRLYLPKTPALLSNLRKQFLEESLGSLRERLGELGQQLIEVKSPLEKTIAQLEESFGITHIYRSHNSGWFEYQQWRSFKARFPTIVFKAYTSHTIFSEAELPFPLEELPPSFSKFRRKVENLAITQPVKAPTSLPARPENIGAWENPKIGLHRGNTSVHFHGGEIAASTHLEKYFSSHHASSYKKTRNGLDGMSYSTKLSPWLANGSLSVRRVISRLRRYESDIESNDSTYWIFFELLWREYFQWYAHRFKEKIFRFGGINNSRPNTAFYPERFKKWCLGNTPFPLINAFMNQLNETGYMSNRGRQLVASCFVHELNLDWRYGASYMESQLIDYDVGSNWGNWQYLAGVGADPRGHRRFNLDKQASVYDPDGEFVAKWAKKDYPSDLDSVDASDWPT